MLKILLCCASGMSTSLLVEKMKRAANEKELEVEIWAVGANEIRTNASSADVILLGPQVRYAKNHIAQDIGDIPMEIISMRDYGMMDGEAVLNFALKLVKENNK